MCPTTQPRRTPKKKNILHKQTTYEQDTQCGRHPWGPLFGQYARKKKSMLPK